MIFLKWFFKKVHYEKQIQQTTKSMQNFPVGRVQAALNLENVVCYLFSRRFILFCFKDGLVSTSSDSCLAMQVQDFNSSFLFSENCTSHHRSICRRPVVNNTVTFDPEFLQMLEELAEPSKKSKAKRRKLTSATDDRKSVQTMGIVGTIYIAVVTMIIVAIDLSNLKGCTKRRHRRLSSLMA